MVFSLPLLKILPFSLFMRIGVKIKVPLTIQKVKLKANLQKSPI